jgi:L-erythro-3,5-diaminohexanoate dehydrogenase
MSVSFRPGGHPFGIHRVVTPAGSLPQAADVLDASLPAYDDEMLLDVETLNIDAASFHQLKDAAKGDADAVAKAVQAIVATRGKMHNPVTNSGGMLIGKVKAIGPKYKGPVHAHVGDRVATLVSLTLTPLSIRAVKKVHLDKDQLDIEGDAILFDSGIGARLDGTLPDRLALAVLDVCGAPAQMARMVRPGMTVAVLGTGKSGMLCLAQARHTLRKSGKLLALDAVATGPEAAVKMGYADQALVVDAKKPLDVFAAVEKATNGAMCDLVVNTVNVAGTEMATVLAARQGGRAYFFNMATNFQAVALGAEGLARDVECTVGVGYAPGHAEWALNLVKQEKPLHEWLGQRFS